MKHILVIFGGRSAEHDVSILTGTAIIKALRTHANYSVYPLYVAKNGGWYSHESLSDVETFKRSPEDLLAYLGKMKPALLDFTDGLTVRWTGLRAKELQIDIAFPAMHGTYGEDGSLMGILRMANIPFVGCDMTASAIAMDKALTKVVTQAAGLPSTPYVWFTRYQWQQQPEDWRTTVNQLTYPLFVKPVHLGSSIGISKIKTPEELDNALEVAFHYDDKVIIEAAVPNLIEVTCLVLGNNELTTSLVEQPLWGKEFLDFNDKYIHGGGSIAQGSQETTKIPAPISPELTARVQDMTKQAIKAIGGVGPARCDFLIDSKLNQVYLNEINTLPGTLYMHNWKKSGVSPSELVDRLVQDAEERFADNKDTTYTFESSVLKNAGGSKGSKIG